MKPVLYVFTNGCEENWPSIEYAAWLAAKMDVEIILVGVLETQGEDHPVEEIFSRAVTLFQEGGVRYRLELKSGQAEDVIAEISNQKVNGLFVFGPFGRPQLRRMVVGRSFRQIMAEVKNPVLYIREARLPVLKVLICLGGLSYGMTVEDLGLQIASAVGADVTFLHVVPPIDLDYPTTRKVRENVNHLVESDTLPGKILRKGLDRARELGLSASAKIRNGNVVEEIVAETQKGYDIICMGSTYSAQGLRHLYAPNVTADVADAAGIPMLTARYQAAPNQK
jgi:nucleotide-binding universal stress UspA family protein